MVTVALKVHVGLELQGDHQAEYAVLQVQVVSQLELVLSRDVIKPSEVGGLQFLAEVGGYHWHLRPQVGQLRLHPDLCEIGLEGFEVAFVVEFKLGDEVAHVLRHVAVELLADDLEREDQVSEQREQQIVFLQEVHCDVQADVQQIVRWL